MRTKEVQAGEEDGRRLEREMLALALFEHPRPLMLREVRATVRRPLELERAIAALVGAGLLSVEGEEIFPTPAAIRFHEIEPIEPPQEA